MTKEDFSAAITALQKGEPVIYPTDTLYALGADIFNKSAVQQIFQIKKRPVSVPLPVAVSSIKDIESIAYLTDDAIKICHRFLPGTLTVLLKKKPCVPAVVTSGLPTIGVRIPNHPVALHLLSKVGPLTVTSANIHLEKTKETISEVLNQLGRRITVAHDSGRLAAAPSTIVDLTTQTAQIVRTGAITEKELQGVLTNG